MGRRAGLALFALVGIVAYTALSVWGWGSWFGFIANPARASLILVLIGLSIAAMFTNSSGIDSGVREDRSNRWVLAPLILVGLVLMYLPPHLDRLNQWVIGGQAIRLLGVVMTLIGGVLRLAPVFALGRRFSGVVAIQPGHALKTDGVYGLIQHPSYLGLLVMTFGWALVFRCVVLAFILAAISMALLVARMDSEEKLLQENFGAEYVGYKKRTWRLIPWVY